MIGAGQRLPAGIVPKCQYRKSLHYRSTRLTPSADPSDTTLLRRCGTSEADAALNHGLFAVTTISLAYSLDPHGFSPGL